jgi:hypothetical protein
MLLYKDAVMPIEGIAPVSQSWAKKHILGFSDEEIKLDLQQQRLEKAVATEIQNTPNVITKTGLFDTVDNLYGSKTPVTGETETTEFGTEGGDEFGAPEATAIETPSGEAPAAEVTPESKTKKMNIILEANESTNIDELDLEKGRRSLGEIEKVLGNLIN